MPGFFEKFIFELEVSYIRMGLKLANHLMSTQNMLSIFIFGSPVCTLLIPCKHGEQTVLQNYLHDDDKRVRENTICLIFRWNYVLHDSYQADEVVIEIEEWKQKVPGDCVKSSIQEFH